MTSEGWVCAEEGGTIETWAGVPILAMEGGWRGGTVGVWLGAEAGLEGPGVILTPGGVCGIGTGCSRPEGGGGGLGVGLLGAGWVWGLQGEGGGLGAGLSWTISGAASGRIESGNCRIYTVREGSDFVLRESGEEGMERLGRGGGGGRSGGLLSLKGLLGWMSGVGARGVRRVFVGVLVRVGGGRLI